MCNASQHAAITRDAQAGEVLSLNSDTPGHPHFYRPGDEAACVSCVKHGARVSVAGLPDVDCRRLGIPISGEFEGTFMQDPHDVSDQIWLGGDAYVSLNDLTDGNISDTIRVTYVRMSTCFELGSFQDAYNDKFKHHPLMYLLTLGNDQPPALTEDDWGYPQEPVSTNEPSGDCAERAVVVDRLPAALTADGTLLSLGAQIAPAQIQSDRELIDA